MLRNAFIAIIVLAAATLPAFGEPTPPVMPKIQPTPLPPAVELPAPSEIPQDLQNHPVTADEAVQIALMRQPSVAAARAGVNSAEGRLKSAKSGLLPGLSVGVEHRNVNSSGEPFGGGVGTGTTGYQTSATIRQLIFDFNRTRELVRQAAAQRRSAQASLSKVEADLVLQVKEAFYSYVQHQRLVRVNENNLRNRQGHLAMAEARLKAGMGLPADVVRAETAVADAIFNLTLARNNASVARVALARLIGVDPRTPIEAADSEEPAIEADSLESLIARALEQRPEMLQAKAAVEAARAGLKAAKTSNLPAISASAGYVGRGASLSTDLSQSTTVGVSVQWSLFDAGLTRGRIQEAQAGEQAAEAQLESMRLAIIAEVSQAYLNLKTAEQRVATADSQVANAQEALRLTEGRYRSGLGTFIDVLDAQTALATADTNRVNAQSEVNVSRVALMHAIGITRAPLP